MFVWFGHFCLLERIGCFIGDAVFLECDFVEFIFDGGRCGNNADFLQVVCFEEADGFFDDAENRNADSVSDLVNKHMK